MTSPGTNPTPRDDIRELERLSLAADLPAMLKRIGDIHGRWDRFSAAERDDVTKLEAIFLTLLQARTGKRP
jgi:hypothetical protein